MSKERNVNIDFNEKKQRFSLTLLFGAVVFLILLTAILLSAIAMLGLAWLGIIGSKAGEIRLGYGGCPLSRP